MSPATVSLLVGALASHGLGEQRLSGLAALELDSRHLRASARWDGAHKVESGAGWIASGSLMWKMGALGLGGSFVHRDGGTWSKDTVWVEPGAAIGPVEVTLRASVAGDTERERGAAVRIDLGRRVQWQALAMRHHAGQIGYTSALAVRLGGQR